MRYIDILMILFSYNLFVFLIFRLGFFLLDLL